MKTVKFLYYKELLNMVSINKLSLIGVIGSLSIVGSSSIYAMENNEESSSTFFQVIVSSKRRAMDSEPCKDQALREVGNFSNAKQAGLTEYISQQVPQYVVLEKQEVKLQPSVAKSGEELQEVEHQPSVVKGIEELQDEEQEFFVAKSREDSSINDEQDVLKEEKAREIPLEKQNKKVEKKLKRNNKKQTEVVVSNKHKHKHKKANSSRESGGSL